MADNVTRNRAGQLVRDTNVLPGALQGLADMLTGAGRGSVAMTLGAPADILNLLRVKQLGGSDIPYGSEYFLKNLPLAPTTQTGRVSQELGGFVPTPAAAVTTPAKTLARVAKASAPYAARHAVELADKYGVSPTMNIIKPKGGNWIAGSVEEAIKPLKNDTSPIISGDIINEAAGRDLFSEYRKVYDKDPTIGLHDWMRANHPEIYSTIQDPADRALNKWLDTKLSKYIRNEMGTPEDPLRRLADEKGVTHIQNQQGLIDIERLNAPYKESWRKEAGVPTEDFGTTPLGRGWEALTDQLISTPTARELTFDPVPEVRYWAKQLPEETRVYELSPRPSTFNSELGFDHLVDELKNAMNPASTLPQHLRLDPAKLDKVTVPQASELVAKINAWRAKEAARAEKEGMMANLQASPRLADENLQLSFVDKPGGTWVDIPETTDPNGFKLCTSVGKAGGWCTQDEWAAKSYGSGENRLATLLDAEGRPHAQAKITKDVDYISAFDNAIESLTPAQEEAFTAYQMSLDRPMELDQGLTWLEENAPQARKLYDKVLTEQPSGPPDITELKPPGNSFNSDRAQEYAKRDPQYKEKVTNSVLNFLNSGKWGNVKDLDHYGIVRIAPESDLGSKLQAAGVQYPEFVSQRQLTELLDNYGRTDLPPSPEGFAEGGLVDDIAPDQIGVNRMVELQEGGVPAYAGGGLVGLESKYGLAPYGLRHAGDSAKGLGYFGAIPGREGHMTEVSAEDDIGEYPLLVPGLTGEEIRHLAEGNAPTDEIYRKAGRHADKRRAAGRSTFIEPGELRHPKPEFASGGIVEYNPAEIENAVARLREDMYA